MEARSSLVPIFILVLFILIVVGSCATNRMASTQQKPTIEDLIGTWVNEEMAWDKIDIKNDGTWLWYRYLTTENPVADTLILTDSWIGKDGIKYFKIHSIEWRGEVGEHAFIFMRLNELGSVIDWNVYHAPILEGKDYDAPDKYPTEINLQPSTGIIYKIYYRQE